MLKWVKSGWRGWLIIIVAEILVLVVSAFHFMHREPINLSFSQEDLLYENGKWDSTWTSPLVLAGL